MVELRAPAFFDYLTEREEVRLRKEAGLSVCFTERKWTDDPIIGSYKFTNVRRHHDKTSDQLRKLIYGPNWGEDRRAVLMNCAVARYFGTWEFSEAVGWQDYDDFDFEGIKELAEERLALRERVFTGAYVITNQGISAPKQEVVVDIFLKGLHERTPELVKIATTTQSWEAVATKMRTLMGFGGSGFMTKEVLLDTTYCDFWSTEIEHEIDGTFTFPEDWNQWTPVGPGAMRGAARLLGDDTAKPLKEGKARDLIMSIYTDQKMWSTFDFELSPTDIQFGLCEFDKYERVRLDQGRPRSRYRVK